jgi:hypothetical protein
MPSSCPYPLLTHRTGSKHKVIVKTNKTSHRPRSRKQGDLYSKICKHSYSWLHNLQLLMNINTPPVEWSDLHIFKPQYLKYLLTECCTAGASLSRVRVLGYLNFKCARRVINLQPIIPYCQGWMDLKADKSLRGPSCVLSYTARQLQSWVRVTLQDWMYIWVSCLCCVEGGLTTERPSPQGVPPITNKKLKKTEKGDFGPY